MARHGRELSYKSDVCSEIPGLGFRKKQGWLKETREEGFLSIQGNAGAATNFI